jgi:hypothetical protein
VLVCCCCVCVCVFLSVLLNGVAGVIATTSTASNSIRTTGGITASGALCVCVCVCVCVCGQHCVLICLLGVLKQALRRLYNDKQHRRHQHQHFRGDHCLRFVSLSLCSLSPPLCVCACVCASSSLPSFPHIILFIP